MAWRKLGDQRNKLILERPIKQRRSVCTIRMYRICLKVCAVGQGILMSCMIRSALTRRHFGWKAESFWRQKATMEAERTLKEAKSNYGSSGPQRKVFYSGGGNVEDQQKHSKETCRMIVAGLLMGLRRSRMKRCRVYHLHFWHWQLVRYWCHSPGWKMGRERYWCLVWSREDRKEAEKREDNMIWTVTCKEWWI